MEFERHTDVSNALVAVLLMLVLPCSLFAQVVRRDSVRVQPVDSAYMAQIEAMIRQAEMQEKLQNSVENYNQMLLKEEMKFHYTNLAPLVSGIIKCYTRHDFINNHPAVFENTNSSVKDYAVAGSPLVAAWIMKAAGLKSRSTARRMATANGFALALAAGLTYGTKQLVSESRPDLSDDHSFPSGHSALAYVGATVISREFGHISPWITVGGYCAATATELLRIRHNAHWVNDIYMGAGIGIVSTDVGYWLADRIFGVDGINKPEMRKADLMRGLKMGGKPSSFALTASTELGGTSISSDKLIVTDNINDYLSGDFHLHLSSFSQVGVEGSWFLTPNLALEAMAQSSTGQAKIYYDRCAEGFTFTGNTLQEYRGSLAVKGSWLLPNTTNRFALRAIGGARHISKVSFYPTVATEYAPREDYCISLPGETKFELGCGLSYDVLATSSHVVGFNADYYHAFSNVIPNRFIISTVWKVLF